MGQVPDAAQGEQEHVPRVHRHAGGHGDGEHGPGGARSGRLPAQDPGSAGLRDLCRDRIGHGLQRAAPGRRVPRGKSFCRYPGEPGGQGGAQDLEREAGAQDQAGHRADGPGVRREHQARGGPAGAAGPCNGRGRDLRSRLQQTARDRPGHQGALRKDRPGGGYRRQREGEAGQVPADRGQGKGGACRRFHGADRPDAPAVGGGHGGIDPAPARCEEPGRDHAAAAQRASGPALRTWTRSIS